MPNSSSHEILLWTDLQRLLQSLKNILSGYPRGESLETWRDVYSHKRGLYGTCSRPRQRAKFRERKREMSHRLRSFFFLGKNDRDTLRKSTQKSPESVRAGGLSPFLPPHRTEGLSLSGEGLGTSGKSFQGCSEKRLPGAKAPEPWNLRLSRNSQQRAVRSWGGKGIKIYNFKRFYKTATTKLQGLRPERSKWSFLKYYFFKHFNISV